MFEIIMQYNPYADEPIDMVQINQCIDLVWDDYTVMNYNFLVLSRTDKASYLQVKISEDAQFVVETLLDGKVYQLLLDDKETVSAIFKGYFMDFDFDITVFTDITHTIQT